MSLASPPDNPARGSSPAVPPSVERQARPGLASRLIPAAGQFLLWITLYLTLLRLPLPATSGLDPSWRMVVGHAFAHKWQWGSDLVFTYGPLGYLLAATNFGEHYADFLVWQVVSNIAMAVVIWLAGRRFRGWRSLFFYLYMLCFVANYQDALHMTVVVLLALSLIREKPAPHWLEILAAAGLAVLSLVKFTNLMLAGFAVACVAVHHIFRRRWISLATGPAFFAAAFLVGWLACGQHLGNLPAYLSTSLNASLGYGEGMAVYESGLIFSLGLAAGIPVAGYYLLALWRRKDFPLALTQVLIVAAYSFLNWKHGFSRADGHVFAHFIACLLIPVTFPLLLEDTAPLRPAKVALLSLSTACSLVAVIVALPTAITDAPAIWNYHLKDIGNALRVAPDLVRNANSEFETISKPHVMPGIKSIVGDEPVDLLGNEQAYVLFNRMNYRPRPVFQTYLTYTEKLLRLNEAYYASPAAPKYVLQKMDTIDHRLPALDDSLAINYLYHHYHFVMEENTFLLWRRADSDSSLDEKKLLGSSTVRFGDVVPVPDLGETPIWAEVDVEPSMLGRLRSFLYKAPILEIGVVDGSGYRANYRLIRSMAAAGFMMYPHFTNATNVQRYMNGEPAPRAQSIAIEVPARDRKYFSRGIAVRFYSMKPLARTPGIAADSPEAMFKMFDRVPAATHALYPVAALREGDSEVLFAHPPSTVDFQVDFPASRVKGRFGMAENAYKPPNHTDGAEFSVEWIGADGQQKVLFKRLLQPTTTAADQGRQSFDVAIPSGGGRLTLRINPGPRGDISFDWAYWTDVRFVP